jgi:predicted secreted protein
MDEPRMAGNMELLDRYQLILKQGLSELKPAISAQPAQAAQEQGEMAPALGDILYRLCIEHGVEFNGFRDSAIELISKEKPVVAGARRGAKSFGAGLERFHSLIVLALETMPPDAVA